MANRLVKSLWIATASQGRPPREASPRPPSAILGVHPSPFDFLARHQEVKGIRSRTSELSCIRSHEWIVENTRAASVRAVRRELVKLFNKTEVQVLLV